MTEAAVRLAEIRSLIDFEAVAALAMAGPAYGYVAGGAWDEETLADNLAAWHRYRLRPRVLVDVSRIDPSTDAFGSPSTMPVAIAPPARSRTLRRQPRRRRAGSSSIPRPTQSARGTSSNAQRQPGIARCC